MGVTWGWTTAYSSVANITPTPAGDAKKSNDDNRILMSCAIDFSETATTTTTKTTLKPDDGGGNFLAVTVICCTA